MIRQYLKRFNAKWIIGTYLRQYLRKTTGTENIPNPPFLIVSNHNSVIDGLGILYVFLKKTNKLIYIITKFNPVNNTMFSRMLKFFWENIGSLMFYNISAWKHMVVTKVVDRLNKGKMVLIFPEGVSNSNNKVLMEGRSGAARIAMTAKVPVIPVGIFDSEKILPIKSYIPRFHRMEIHIGKPMTFEKYYGKQDDKETVEKVTREIMTKIGELCKKEYPY